MVKYYFTCKMLGCMGHPDMLELVLFAGKSAQLICLSLGRNQAQRWHDAKELLGYYSVTITALSRHFVPVTLVSTVGENVVRARHIE